MSLQYLKKEVDEIDFLRTDKHHSGLQVDFRLQTKKNQETRKTCWSYEAVPSPSAKINFFSILPKNYWKIEIELFPQGTISHENQSLTQIVFE